jgi:hypothetical protein
MLTTRATGPLAGPGCNAHRPVATILGCGPRPSKGRCRRERGRAVTGRVAPVGAPRALALGAPPCGPAGGGLLPGPRSRGQADAALDRSARIACHARPALVGGIRSLTGLALDNAIRRAASLVIEAGYALLQALDRGANRPPESQARKWAAARLPPGWRHPAAFPLPASMVCSETPTKGTKSPECNPLRHRASCSTRCCWGVRAVAQPCVGGVGRGWAAAARARRCVRPAAGGARVTAFSCGVAREVRLAPEPGLQSPPARGRRTGWGTGPGRCGRGDRTDRAAPFRRQDPLAPRSEFPHSFQVIPAPTFRRSPQVPSTELWRLAER